MTNRIFFLAALLHVASSASAAVEISNVHHTPSSLDAAAKGKVAVRFHTSAPAVVRVDLWDGRDLRVRSLGDDRLLPAGDHELVWDGRDAKGRPVPSEAYTYSIHAKSENGAPSLWDLTDVTGGEMFEPEALALDAAQKRFRYRLAKPARVRIRIGLANDGPLLRTLVDWVPRAAGAHAEAWDGRDASGVLELSSHPSLVWIAKAFSLPANTILVLPERSRVELIADLATPHVEREREAPVRPRMLDYPHQALEERRDFPLVLELPKDLARTSAGLPIVSRPLPLRVSVKDADQARVLNQRCEAVFFVDGRFVFENEVAFLPITWTWDPAGTAEGEHYLSANLRGYEGHFGMATVKVMVRAQGGSP